MSTYPTKKLGEVLDYEQPGKYIVNSKNYSNDYKTPVLTAGKTFILGNTDEKENVFPSEKLPVIIFDDFTTTIKFVDFPFKVKSSAMKILHAKKGVADIKYLFYLMQTIELNHATHKRYWISEFSQLEIPLPPLSEQKKIVTRLEGLLKKIKEAKRLRAEAQEAAQNLLPAELHRIFTQQDSYSLIRANKRIVGKLTTTHKQHTYKLENVRMFNKSASVKTSADKWEEKELGEICELNPKKSEIKDKADDFLVSFVPMSAVDEYLQAIVLLQERSLGEVRKGYTYFKNGDVLFAKITPCMENGKVAIARNLKNSIGFGTTEFHVFRAKKKVLPEWIHYIIGQPSFREIAKTRMTGSAGQKRVPVQFLEKFKIPLPPVAEQKKIVSRLDSLSEKIKNLREYQKDTKSNMQNLERSILYKAFESK
ncbi:MAG: restriction endonuclease subunit S [Candidatus Sungbacteria bacterium]|nr:restriction endonuclease subunit S [Candidatus Sungbacteria bacterium]